MKIKTGNTVYEIVVSADSNNVPVIGPTFDQKYFIDGNLMSAITLTIALSDNSSGTYKISWTPLVYGKHQFYLNNITTNIIYVSDVYEVVPDSEFDLSTTIYVGV